MIKMGLLIRISPASCDRGGGHVRPRLCGAGRGNGGVASGCQFQTRIGRSMFLTREVLRVVEFSKRLPTFEPGPYFSWLGQMTQERVNRKLAAILAADERENARLYGCRCFR